MPGTHKAHAGAHGGLQTMASSPLFSAPFAPNAGDVPEDADPGLSTSEVMQMDNGSVDEGAWPADPADLPPDDGDGVDWPASPLEEATSPLAWDPLPLPRAQTPARLPPASPTMDRAPLSSPLRGDEAGARLAKSRPRVHPSMSKRQRARDRVEAGGERAALYEIRPTTPDSFPPGAAGIAHGGVRATRAAVQGGR